MYKEYRSSMKADGCWRFCFDKEKMGLQSQWYKNGIPNFRKVKLPHTFNVEAEAQEYRGTVWYEYHFKPDDAWRGKKIYIQFNGVYRDADIWMNGMKIGRHYNSGFTAFQVDTKDTVRMDNVNILILRVDNSYSDKAIPIDNSFDWADDGGIFRKVTFIAVNPNAIDYVKLMPQPVIKEYGHRSRQAEAVFSAKVYLHPDNEEHNTARQLRPQECNEQIHYEYQIFEGTEDSKVLIYQSGQLAVNRNSYFDIQPVKLNSVKLWHFDEPVLYTANISLLRENMVYDLYEITFGFRELISRGDQLFLNGEPVRLAGAEWMPGSNPAYGNAEPEVYMSKILTQMKECNCIFTRFHWQQDDYVYDWCDRNGMLVQEEIPNWGSMEQTEWQLRISKDQADEMIRYHCNHPSIISWGIGNELRGQEESTKQILQELKAYFAAEDPHRLVNYITCTIWENPSNDAAAIGDSLWVNDYIGTWHGNLNNEEQLRNVVSAHPDRPLIISEFGLCEPAFEGGDKRRTEIFKEKINLYRSFPQISGIIYFCLNDYRTQMGEEGQGVLRRRVHGSTDLFGEPKPSYYEVQKLYAPLSIVRIDDQSITLRASNDLPRYEVDDYCLQITERADYGCTKYKIPRLLPGDSCTIDIQNTKESIKTIRISRPAGFLVDELIMC